MPKFRKLPVVIEAILYDWDESNEPQGMDEAQDAVADFMEGNLSAIGEILEIETLEGTMDAVKGDYIIKGIAGEFYPCKPDIFAKTYEQVNDPVCTAPQDPDHELTEDEVATLASNGSLCDCMEVVQYGGDCPIEEGDEFDFGSAIYLLKIGKKVARKGWNGSGMFVYYVPAASYPVERNNLETMGGQFPDDMVPYREYLALKTAQGDVATWTPSVSDALATDWCLA